MSMRLQHLVESAVARFGARPALKHDGRCLSYFELDDAARGVADQLAAMGAQPESIVAIVMPKGIEQLVTVLGALKAGCAFLPVDANYPPARQKQMLDACAVDFIVHLGAGGFSIARQAQAPARAQPSGADHLAYVIYTSGSTGTPCAVGVEHAGIVNTVQWRNQYYEFTEQDRVLQIPSPSFDSSIVDVFCALSSGARLVLIDDRDRLNPAALKKLLVEERITHLLVTPTYYKAILPVAYAALEKVRVITIAGEAFDKSLTARHFELLPDVRLVNEYGPTENSVCSLYDEVRPDEEILIGLPIPNVDCSVRNEAGDEVADGEAGELWLSGVGLARGYLNSQQLTELRFPADPLDPGRRAYRTGDRVQREASGKYRFLGRLDRQVKISGVRVDLLEIERKIAECGGVADVLVCAVGDASVTDLVAYYVPADAQARTEEIRRSLEERLPRLMVPTRIVALDAFPVSPNGKVDVQRLLAESRSRVAEDSCLVDSLDELEGTLLAEFLKHIPAPNESLPPRRTLRTTSFASLGMTSVRLLTFLVDIESRLGVEFDFPRLAEHDLLSIEKLAAEVLWRRERTQSRSPPSDAGPECSTAFSDGGWR